MPNNLQTLLKIKGVEDAEGRFIEGWATTGRQDRVGDIVEPSGAIFEIPLPLLFQHDHKSPIGAVVAASATRAGIRIRAKLTAGVERAEEVWRLIKDGGLSALSIGFIPKGQTPLPSGGYRFDSWEWTELSVVSVAANPDAKMSIAKCVAFAPAREKQIYAPNSNKINLDVQLLGAELAKVVNMALLPLKSRITEIEKSNKSISDFDPEIFGAAVGDAICKALEPIKARVTALENIHGVTGGLKFCGEFQEALGYESGSIVKSAGGLFVSVRDIDAGNKEPQHQGGGWVKMN